METKLHDLISEQVYTKTTELEPLKTFRPKLSWVMDFKKVSLQPEFLKLFVNEFDKLVLANIAGPIQIAGMESGALPLLTALALAYPNRIKNSFYFRKSRKKGDLAKQIEGTFEPTLPVILVDDILNSGSTTLKQIKILETLQANILGLFAIIRFRKISYYEGIWGNNIKIFSSYELNDFSQNLGLSNIETPVTKDLPLVYEPVWKVIVSKANHYDVLPKSAPAADSEHIFVGTDEGSLVAINKETGNLVWEFKTHFNKTLKGIYSSPLIYENSIYFGAYDGNVYCLDKHTGERRWVSFEGDYVGSSPCVADDKHLIFIGLEFGLFTKRGGVVALDSMTGKTKWINREISDFVHASPAYSMKHSLVVCGSNNGVMYALSANTGEIIWSFKTDGAIKYRAVFDDKNNFVIFGSFDGTIYVLDTKTGILVNKFLASAGFYSVPVLYKELIIIGSMDKNIYAYNYKKAEPEWVFETNGRVFASPVIDNDLVYVGSNDGALYILQAETGDLVGKIQLTERIVNAAVVEAGNMYIGTHAAELYKFARIN